LKRNNLHNFQINGHLTDEGIAQYAEALKLDKIESLPERLQQHIANCEDCHRQALELYAVIVEFDYSEVALTTAKRVTMSPVWVRRALLAAASIAALIWMVSLLWRPGSGVLKPIAPQMVTRDSQLQTMPPSSTKEQRVSKIQVPVEPVPKDVLAANFEPSTTLEELLEGTTRGEEITVNTPLNTASFAPGQVISFNWTGAGAGPWQVIILNNHNKEQYRLEADAEGLTFTGRLNPGIYYWKLENETDLIYVGKFFIR
jgi:hypothetical protein